MRFLLFLWLFVPLSALANPICPAGYSLNNMGLCSQKWSLSQGSCAEGSYLEPRSKTCQARCPFGSTEELSERGDKVCQREGKREWLGFFTQQCAKAGLRYQPQIHMCEGDIETTETEEEREACGPGKVARVDAVGVFSCVPGNPEAVLKKMQEKLEREGLTYAEYLETMKDIQTTRLGAEVMHYQWEVATGKQPANTASSATPARNCPDGYKPNETGGCRPAQSCSNYGCPNGKPANLISDGRNQYCGC